MGVDLKGDLGVGGRLRAYIVLAFFVVPVLAFGAPAATADTISGLR